MRKSGLTLVECIVTIAIFIIIYSATQPLLSWYSLYKEKLTCQQLESIIHYARTQAILLGKDLRLTTLKSNNNWSMGVRLEHDDSNHMLIYEWNFPYTSLNIQWHGFEKDSLHIAREWSHAAMNGYFSIEKHGVCIKKIIINRVGRSRIV